MRLLKYRYSGETVLGICAAAAILFMVLLNNENIKFRMAEIKSILSGSDTVSGTIDHAGLIVQYRFRMDLYNKKIDPFNAEIIEMRADSLFASAFADDFSMSEVSSAFSFAADIMKLMLGKKSLTPEVSKRNSLVLESAYYFERNSLYAKALEKYDEAVKTGRMSESELGGIMLHQGFCRSMAGDIDGAKNKYISVIKNYPDDVISITASVLLGYLEDIIRETERVRVMPDTPEKGEKLFYLTAFRDSLSVIESIEKKGKINTPDSVIFFKARCLESTGNASEALVHYQEIITKNPHSQFAKSANRRIFLISTKVGDDSVSHKLALKNNSIIRDRYFISLMKEGAILKNKLISRTLWPADKPIPDFESLLSKSEKSDTGLSGTSVSYSGRRVKVTTSNGDIIRGLVVSEDNKNITVETIAGEAVIRKSGIVRSVFE